MNEYMNEVFDCYARQYTSILKYLWPAKGNTGFTERNLTCNFSKAYEKITLEKGKDAYTWFEFQFGDDNDQHYDAIIVNPTDKKIIVIESKRFNTQVSKIRSVNKDIHRITEFPDALKKEVLRNEVEKMRIYDFEKFEVWGMILADVWDEKRDGDKGDLRSKIADEFRDGTFLDHETQVEFNSSDLCGLKYKYISFEHQEHAEKYRLLSFYWRVREAYA